MDQTAHNEVADYIELLAQVTQHLGRPLRVLHLGNVANYAYVNAKIMRNLGVEADVFDPDFFHIMATPEWHEGKFDAEFPDHFKPIWHHVDLGEFRRPSWFVQGPFLEALASLAQTQGKPTWLKVWAANFNLSLAMRRSLNDFPGPISRFLLASSNSIARCIRLPVTLVSRVCQWTARPDCAQATAPDDFPIESRLDETVAKSLAGVLDYYDIVHGYTLSAQLAAQVGHKRYVACELGTLRGLPFEDSPTGRLAAWLYRHAPEVMITNFDCMPAAEKLGIPRSRTTAILHPFDVDGAHADIGTEFQPPDKGDVPVFFAPARHHWSRGNASWLKGNHIYIHALAQLAKEGLDFKLVTVDWGQEVQESRALIAELGLSSKVQWIAPAPRRSLWRWYRTCAAIIDQFNAESFGGVGLDAMFSGRRLITRFSANANKPFFDVSPPIQSASTIEDVARAARRILADPADNAKEGLALHAWVRKFHGLDQQLRPQFQVYLRLLKSDA